MLCPRREIQPHVVKGLKVGALCSIALWLVVVAFSINFSSIGMWDRVLPQVDNEHLILGEPKGIRSDEWLANSPIMLAYAGRAKTHVQGVMDFAGPPGAELLMNQPAPHFVTFFRPQFWGFFLFDRDRGFSFLYATKLVLLGFVFFSISLLLCENAAIAFCATVWLCFSSFFQWWFSICLPELVASGLLAALAAWVVLYAGSTLVALVSAVVMIVSLLNFTMCMYPPFMVPVAHGAIAIGMTLTLKYGVVQGRPLLKRLALLGLGGMVFAGILALVYRDIAAVVESVQNTAYPGRRVSVAGTVPGYRYLNNLADLFFTESRFPAWLGNVCEAAGFIIIWPLLIPLLLFRRIRGEISGRDLILFAPMLVILVCHLAWMSWGLPQWFGTLTGLSLAAGQRAYLGQGVFGILVVSMATALLPRRALSACSGVWLGALCVVFAIGLGWCIERSMPSFLSDSELTWLAISLGVSVTGLVSAVPVMFWCPIILLVSPNAFINPVARGVKPITERKIVSFAAKMVRSDPNARWVVFGDGGYANLLKVGGARVFNGVVYAPRMNDYQAFDSQGTYRDVYNRYAHVGLEATGSPEDQATFHVIQGDSFVMKVHPCHPAFEQVGVTYFLFTYEPPPQQVACLERIGQGHTGARFKVFRRKNYTPPKELIVSDSP